MSLICRARLNVRTITSSYTVQQLRLTPLLPVNSAICLSSLSGRQLHTTLQLRTSKPSSNAHQNVHMASNNKNNNPRPRTSSHLGSSIAEGPSQRHKDDSWKLRAPYQIQNDDEFGPVKWEGRCHCGNVQYQLKRERPLAAKYCHCRACQVLHAAPFQWSAIFQKTDMRFKKGTDSLMFYSSHEKSKEYQVPTKVYCSNCNSPIMDEGRNMCMIFPELIDMGETEEEHLARRKVFEIDRHMFYSKRLVEVHDGKPKWSELDEHSDRLDDDGHKL